MIQSRKIYRYLLVTISVLSIFGCLQGPKKVSEKTDTLNTALWELANGAEATSNYEKAASYFDRIYQRHPKDKEALLGYARNLRYLGLPKESIKAIQAASEVFNNDTNLKIELAKSQLAASLIHDAHLTLKDAAQEDPVRWEIYSALGIINDRIENYEEAQKAYKRALKLSPNNVDVNNNLALSFAQSGNLAKAIKILQKIVRSENSSLQSRQNLALLYGLNGQLKKAKELAKVDLTDSVVDQNFLTFKELHASENLTRSKSALSDPEKVVKVDQRKSNVWQFKNQEEFHPLVGIYSTIEETIVRKGPGTSHQTIALLKKGKKVRKLGYSLDKKWSFVELTNGRRGYVNHNLLKKNELSKAQ